MEHDQPRLDQATIQRLLRNEVMKALQGLTDLNNKLKRVLRDSLKDNIRLQEENNQLKEGLELAIQIIRGLKQGPKRTSRQDLLEYLGVQGTTLPIINSKRRLELNDALRRTAMLVHPDSHPNESPLVGRVLTFLITPLTDAIDRTKRD